MVYAQLSRQAKNTWTLFALVEEVETLQAKTSKWRITEEEKNNQEEKKKNSNYPTQVLTEAHGTHSPKTSATCYEPPSEYRDMGSGLGKITHTWRELSDFESRAGEGRIIFHSIITLDWIM